MIVEPFTMNFISGKKILELICEFSENKLDSIEKYLNKPNCFRYQDYIKNLFDQISIVLSESSIFKEEFFAFLIIRRLGTYILEKQINIGF